MQPIRVHISQLGLVKAADIELSPMMVFSGESGLGKSYVAIITHFFFHLWLNEKRLDSFFKTTLKNRCVNFSDSQIEEQGNALTISREELEEWLAKEALNYLGYMLGCDCNGDDNEISVFLPPVIPNVISFSYERELMGIDNNEDLYWKLTVMDLTYRFRQLGIQDESPYSYVFRHAMIAKLFGNYQALSTSMALPPSRGSFFTENISPKTGLFKNFIDGMKRLEAANEIQDVISSEAVKLFQTIMEGNVQKNGDKYMYTTHGDDLPIAAAASSVREMAPLQLIVSKRDLKKTALLIEEPEAHLHPLKQSMIAEALGLMANGGVYMQITTHSDYLLRRLTDLLRLHILREKMPQEEYLNLCEDLEFNPELTLPNNIVNAYILERREDGSVQIRKQDVKKGIPFDTFEKINGKPLVSSSKLYEVFLDYLTE